MICKTPVFALLSATACLAVGAVRAGPVTVAITNAHIFTMAAAGVIPSGTILLRDGKIVAVGQDINVPDDSTVIDAHGEIATPGFMLLGSAGLTTEMPFAPGLDDSHTTSAELSAGYDIRYGVNPDSTYIPEVRREGATLVLVAPGQAEGKRPYGYFGGQAAIVDVAVGAAPIVSSRVAVTLVMGVGGANLAGGGRPAEIQQLRHLFAQLQSSPADPKLTIPGLSAEDIEALRPVAAGKTVLLVQVHSAPDILQALDLANAFKLKIVLEGAEEAWRVAGQIAAARVPVVVAPEVNSPSSMENWGITLANAGLLEKAGVRVAFELSPSAAMFRFPTVRYMGAAAVANGMSYRAALEALTLVPAQVFGVGDRYGSLEAGKQGDIVLWTGDPLEPASYAETVLISGVPQPLTSRQTLLRDRYMPKEITR